MDRHGIVSYLQRKTEEEEAGFNMRLQFLAQKTEDLLLSVGSSQPKEFGRRKPHMKGKEEDNDNSSILNHLA